MELHPTATGEEIAAALRDLDDFEPQALVESRSFAQAARRKTGATQVRRSWER